MSAASSPAPRTQRLAVGSLVLSGLLWGTTWIPLKSFAKAGYDGLATTLLAYGAVGLFSLPLIWRERAAWKRQSTLFVAAAFAGGLTNVCFVSALMLGDVVRTMLLFYLSPIWAVLGARFFLAEPISRWRVLGVAMAVSGAILVLDGPRLLLKHGSPADVLGLGAGFFYAAQNIGFRAAHRVPVLSKALSMFVASAVLAALFYPVAGGHFPPLTGTLVVELLAFAGIWLVSAMCTTMYGVTHLDAGRAAILLVFELLAVVLSAMLIGGERLNTLEWLGAVLIVAATLLDAWVASSRRPSIAF